MPPTLVLRPPPTHRDRTLRSLRSTLRRASGATDTPGPDIHTEVVDDRSTGLPVVGREAEARALDEAVDRATHGTACAVLVRGEAGIGKTTLVRDAARRAERDGATVLWAPCLRFGAVESTFLPLVLALE